MKTRTGFVSNSSSSSFLLLGFARDEELEGFDYDYRSGDTYYYGNCLVYGLDDTESEFDLSEFPAMIQKIVDEYGVDPSEIKLHIANTEC